MFRHLGTQLLFGALVLGTALTSVRADEGADYEKLISEKGAALVNVKYVLKLGGQFGESEREMESTGVMIDPKGLVLCSSTGVGSPMMLRRLGGSATPTDIKVLVGDDEDGVEAKLLARDSELDLAWVQIKAPSSKPYVYIDIENPAIPKLGQRLLSLRRMGKHFDRTPVVSEGRMFGRTKKPRELFVPGGGLDAQPGTPVFNGNGSFVGMVVVQLPDPEDMEGGAQSMFGGSRDFATLILPAADVLKATARARTSKGEGEEMSAKAAAAASKPTSKPTEKQGPAKKGTTRPADEDEDE